VCFLKFRGEKERERENFCLSNPDQGEFKISHPLLIRYFKIALEKQINSILINYVEFNQRLRLSPR
jgi:hypothetical protein